jgi:N-acetylmuramic acid 6-phosphate (MurNAc-6-P) etherase
MTERKMDKLLTEQPNPASEAIDTLPTERILSIINGEDQKVPPPWPEPCRTSPAP